MELSIADWDEIIQALEYARQAKEGSTSYPSYEFKQQMLDANRALLNKARALRKKAKETTK